jgi:hypothetical protein
MGMHRQVHEPAHFELLPTHATVQPGASRRRRSLSVIRSFS